MSRDIKFRVWDKLRKKVRFDINIPSDYTKVNGNLDLLSMFQSLQQRYEFMQYTGLKDKDGKEIYEGDVFEHNIQDYVDGFPREENHTKIVTYDNGAFWVGDYLLADAIANDSEAEVIGNIFEHSHLLEQHHD